MAGVTSPPTGAGAAGAAGCLLAPKFAPRALASPPGDASFNEIPASGSDPLTEMCLVEILGAAFAEFAALRGLPAATGVALAGAALTGAFELVRSGCAAAAIGEFVGTSSDVAGAAGACPAEVPAKTRPARACLYHQLAAASRTIPTSAAKTRP